MRGTLLSVVLLTGAVVMVAQVVPNRSEKGKEPPAAQPDKEQAANPRPANHEADEAAIRANIAAFVRAYNAGDAKAVAALFTPQGLIVDKDEHTSQGQATIEKTFKEIFAAAPQKRLEVFVDTIHFLAEDLAVEVGTTKETSVPGECPTSTATPCCTSSATASGRWPWPATRRARAAAGPRSPPAARLAGRRVGR